MNCKSKKSCYNRAERDHYNRPYFACELEPGNFVACSYADMVTNKQMCPYWRIEDYTYINKKTMQNAIIGKLGIEEKDN